MQRIRFEKVLLPYQDYGTEILRTWSYSDKDYEHAFVPTRAPQAGVRRGLFLFRGGGVWGLQGDTIVSTAARVGNALDPINPVGAIIAAEGRIRSHLPAGYARARAVPLTSTELSRDSSVSPALPALPFEEASRSALGEQRWGGPDGWFSAAASSAAESGRSTSRLQAQLAPSSEAHDSRCACGLPQLCWPAAGGTSGTLTGAWRLYKPADLQGRSVSEPGSPCKSGPALQREPAQRDSEPSGVGRVPRR